MCDLSCGSASDRLRFQDDGLRAEREVGDLSRGVGLQAVRVRRVGQGHNRTVL